MAEGAYHPASMRPTQWGDYERAGDVCRRARGVFAAGVVQRCVENHKQNHSVMLDMIDTEGRRQADIVWNRVSYLADISNIAKRSRAIALEAARLLLVSGSAYAPSTEMNRLTASPQPYAANSVPTSTPIQPGSPRNNPSPTAITSSIGTMYSEKPTTRAVNSTRPGTPAITFAAYALPCPAEVDE